MPIKNKQRKMMKKVQSRPRQNKPRKQPRAGASIARGLAGIANQFMPGGGLMVSGISKLLGFGAYTTAEAESILASKVPTMNATLDRGVRVSHHEYLADVSSATAFAVNAYPLNPGLAVTFPWLSTVAAAFQEYEMNGCVFYFKATSANALNSTNTALGQIIGATQYNPYASPPPNKIAMLGLASASDGKPSECNIYPIECKSDMILMRSKLVRTGAVTDDLAKYDHGNFFLGANGSQAIAVVGELHIVYDITLKKPKLYVEGASTSWYYHEYCPSPIATSLLPFAGATTIVSNSLGVTRGSNVMSIPAGAVVGGTKYRMQIIWIGTAASVQKPSVLLTNATTINDLYNTTWSIGSPANSVSSTSYVLTNTFIATNSAYPITITVALDGTIPTNSSWDLEISEVQ